MNVLDYCKLFTTKNNNNNNKFLNLNNYLISSVYFI